MFAKGIFKKINPLMSESVELLSSCSLLGQLGKFLSLASLVWFVQDVKNSHDLLPSIMLMLLGINLRISGLAKILFLQRRQSKNLSGKGDEHE